MRILITGAGRGLGLEFVRQYLEAGDQVFALARDPQSSPGLREISGHDGRLLIVACDVARDASVAEALKEVKWETDALDLVLNNAGTYGPDSESLESLAFDEARRVFEVNALGPIRVARAFLPLLRRGDQPRLVHITSMMGCVEDNRSGGHWSYRMSKAALNMASRNLALELENAGILSVALSPGWVRTDMGGPGAPLSAAQSVASMVKTIALLTKRQSGALLDRNGDPPNIS